MKNFYLFFAIAIILTACGQNYNGSGSLGDSVYLTSSSCTSSVVLPDLIDNDTTITADTIIIDSTVIVGANVNLMYDSHVSVENHLSIDDSSTVTLTQILCDD